MPTSNGYRSIVDSIERSMAGGGALPFDSISRIASHFGVSYATGWRAVEILRLKGLVISVRGRGIAATRRNENQSPAFSSPADRLFSAVRDDVLSGVYKSGKPFPKIRHFMGSHSVSAPTVTRAFLRLADAGLAHKQRNRWIAGPRPALKHASARTVSQLPAAVALYGSTPAWTFGFADPFVNTFFSSFSSELLGRGIILSPCLREQDWQKGLALPAGRDEVIGHIRSLGDRYLGTITMSVDPGPDDLAGWFDALLRFDKPVIYFDQADKGAGLARRRFAGSQHYYRVHQDERKGIVAALDECARNGHSRIAIHGSALDKGWTPRRTRAFVDLAARQSPPMHVFSDPQIEPWWDFTDRFAMYTFVSKAAEKAGVDDPFESGNAESLHRFRDLLIEQAPSLVSLLLESKATVLACLNDRMAREYYFWLKALGIQVPADMSMLSFDNIPEASMFPISTIDWGFERLGYLAAHILVDDIPVKTDRQGNIPGECRMADRGSIGKPGDGAKAAKILRR
jgi:DNA-binding LacI/PurR family transcriptional regulator/DNA-binding transcriptional regulator YhcF (GntR family)